MTTEEQTFSTEPGGLREAAAEITNARVEGRAVSSPEPPAKETETPPPTQRRWEDGLTEAPDREKPVLPLGFEKGLDVRDASKALSAIRHEERKQSEGDLELQRELERLSQAENPDEAARMVEGLDEATKDRLVAEVERQSQVTNALEQTQAEIQAELARVRADRDAKLAEIEQRKANEAAATERERRLTELAQGASDLPKIEHELLTNLAEKYPDASNQFGVERLRQENPTRYAEYCRDYQIAQTIYKAKALDELATKAQIQQQQAQRDAQRTHQTVHEGARYAREQVAKFDERHPEFSGEAGRQRLNGLIENAIEARVQRDGLSREEIRAEFDSNPNSWRIDKLESFIADGARWKGQKELKAGRVPPQVLKVQRPGAGREPGSHRGDQLNSLYKAADAKQDVRSWGRWLAEARRNAR